MARWILFEDDVSVHYGFVYLDSGVGYWDQTVNQRAGQRNGLAGAAQVGFIQLTTATHTGLVPIRVELHAEEPLLDDSWDEIVEVSWEVRGPNISLAAFDGGFGEINLHHSGPHRLRYAASNFAEDPDERYEPEDPVQDSYLVQIWPERMRPDKIIKQTSTPAAYWHRVAQKAKKPNPTPYDQALAELQHLQQRKMAEQAYDRASYLQDWGGREPTPRLQRLDPRVRKLTREHRDLVDAIEALPPKRQRALTLQVVRRSCAADRGGRIDWSPALAALDRGDPLPPPFDDETRLDELMFDPSAVSYITFTLNSADAERLPLHTGVAAAAAVRAAANPDPLTAALLAIEAACWSAADESAYFAGISELLR